MYKSKHNLFCLAQGLCGLVLLSLLAACGAPSNRVRIKGEIKGLVDADLYIYSETGNRTSIDTIHVQSDQFDYECPCDETEILTLLFPSFSTLPIIAEGGETIKISGDGNRLSQLAVSGTDANADFSDLRIRLAPMSKQDQAREAATFVRANAKSPAALAALMHYFGHRTPMSAEPLQNLLATIGESQGKSALYKAVSSTLSSSLRLAIGARLPDFECTTLDGERFSSKRLHGKPILLYIRASWAQSNYDMTTTIRTLRHNNPRHYEIVILNLDTDLTSARNATNYDSLQMCTTLYDDRGIASPLVPQLGIDLVPCVIMTDAQGRITDVCADHIELRHSLRL